MAPGRRTIHSSEWEGTQTLRRERHAHKWPSMMRGAMLARPTKRETYHRALRSGEKLILQNERGLRRSEGSGMLISDPLGEGSNASFTDSELWRAEKSTLRMRGNSDAQKGAACSKMTLLVRGATLALTDSELWRAEDSFLRWEET